ncbi:hypothetical protein [Sinimarinibacterium sp. NLF-5-8]|uniref:hypothetical protein n=1 Tax=Sinimarinibacterium sp. NLF-5-8 TaxID=2698684 RepID=UPI00137B99D3|nr:hypothetical protein [Sinimarinibacterium sp. NLF-5-8]QHS10778.1 hypothetical protein GT972_11930 [Sinimarinibacterium sp. NLF-5-8]
MLPAELVAEIAREVCTGQLTDYRLAKQRALARLGLPARTPLPDNRAIHAAVIDYQRLFGGSAYRAHLQQMRQAAHQAMHLLQAFAPRLVGAALSGAVTPAHHVQLHAFADPAEAVDLFLMDRHLRYEADERRYRYPNGQEEQVPLIRLQWQRIGVDIAVFGADDVRRVPINPVDGKAFVRADAAAVQRLLDASAPD